MDVVHNLWEDDIVCPPDSTSYMYISFSLVFETTTTKCKNINHTDGDVNKLPTKTTNGLTRVGAGDVLASKNANVC